MRMRMAIRIDERRRHLLCLIVLSFFYFFKGGVCLRCVRVQVSGARWVWYSATPDFPHPSFVMPLSWMLGAGHGMALGRCCVLSAVRILRDT